MRLEAARRTKTGTFLSHPVFSLAVCPRTFYLLPYTPVAEKQVRSLKRNKYVASRLDNRKNFSQERR